MQKISGIFKGNKATLQLDMAFGTELQGRTSHEALLAIQDAEIQLLETIKKSITQRIKCDRDYAIALSTMVTTAQKQNTVQNGPPTYSV
jgi:hypothetical protein